LRVYGWTDTRGYHESAFISFKSVPAEYSKDIPVPPDLALSYVRGLILSEDDDTSVSWESALEGTSGDKAYGTKQALLKSGITDKFFGVGFAGKTLVNSTESMQVFSSIDAQEKTISILLVAYNNSFVEVEGAFAMLKKMASPELQEGLIAGAVKDFKDESDNSANGGNMLDGYIGYTPLDCIVTIGNKILPRRYVITNVSSEREAVKNDRKGNPVSRVVNITLKSKKSINRSDIRN